jgi:hypothetical protein
MGIFDFLSPALTVASEGVAAHNEGKEQGNALLRAIGLQQSTEDAKRAQAAKDWRASRAPQLGDPEYTAARRDVAGAEAAAKAPYAPKPQPRLTTSEDGIMQVGQDGTATPVTQNGKTLRPLRQATETPAQKRAAAIDQHKATRDYDIAHPMPQQDNAKMTEFSNKAALVYQRAADAAKLLDSAYEKGVPPTSLLGKVTGGNYGLPEDVQKWNSAAETVSSSILRLESGAAISEHEVKEYAKQFLPQPGDGPQVRADKKARLQTQLERMRQAASPTTRRDSAPAVTTPPAAASHAQQLWDAAVAKHGKATVEEEYGPRPSHD